MLSNSVRQANHSLNTHNDNVFADRNLKIMLVDLSKRYGGASTRALLLADQLRTWRVSIAGIKNGAVLKVALERGIPVHIVGNSRLDPLIPFRLAKIIKRGGYNIIDTQNIQSKFWGSLAALLTEVAFVSTVNSSYFDEYGRGFKGRFYRFVDAHTNWRTDCHIAVSSVIKTELINAGVSEDTIHVIRNAVGNYGVSPLYEREAFRQHIGVPGDACLCASVGRLVWAKGYEDLIRAFRLVLEKIPNAYAVIAGEGILYSALLSQIRDAGLTGRILLLGHCESAMIQTILKASDLFVMPSRIEGIPFALLEAAAAGLPIVATNCGGIPEVVEHGKEAILVPVGDPFALSRAIVELCLDDEFAKELGKRAKRRMEKELNLAAQINALKQVYATVLARRNRKINDE